MGLSSLSIPNIPGYGEDAQSLIFPASSIRAEIPVYLKFVAVEYGQNALQRSGALISANSGGIGNVKAYIAVPFPSKFTTQTAMRYKQEENPGVVGGDTEALLAMISDQAKQLNKRLTDTFSQNELAATLGAGAFRLAKVAGSFGSLIESDYTETILQSGSKRTFQIQLYLPCLNTADSNAAANITRAFEALALPSYIGANALATGIDLFFHPPMWFISAGSLNSISNDFRWTSQPQASVLTNVAVNRVAIDAPSLAALNTGAPFAYTVTLNFQEIETAVRPVGKGFTILNRSSAGLSNTASVASLVTGG